MESFLDENSPGDDGPVLVNNPPAYYASTGRSALMIPYGKETTVLDLARQFSASHLLLDGNHISQLDDLYQNPKNPRVGFRYIGELDGIQIFELHPDEVIP